MQMHFQLPVELLILYQNKKQKPETMQIYLYWGFSVSGNVCKKKGREDGREL